MAMYGAKSAIIRDIAKDVWSVPDIADTADSAKRDATIEHAIYEIDANNNIALNALGDLPAQLQNEEFVRLVVALANCPLVQ